MPRRAIVIVAAVIAIAALAYLRDPPWLLTQTSGLRGWEADPDGRRLRWMGGHASFFVPSSARVIEIPIRTAFSRPDDGPIAVSVSLDDRPVDRVVLTDNAWRRSVVRLPAPGSRRVRRIDLRCDRTREDNRGAAVGEPTVR